ncbi:conserved unknown protein [Ectocarpus siliculosus]|uniref:Phosphoglycerate mutase n=1 Tax=Ectocarpus siliculosus TaxID=2880 RepID=D8LQF3_ECTSI|nr:conserved unknown protein [Ectocarpus siliculosus]|eukprot:CBN78717.1 conserved unknown protein [Ectocarpus siliculosus]
MKGGAVLACLVLQAKAAVGFVAPSVVARGRVQSAAAAAAVRLGDNAATLRSVRGARSGMSMAAPETTPEGDDTYTLVVVRHGESTWNNENRFTGWKDVPLSDKGQEEAAQSGELIAESGLTFDVAYTSVLKRAINTLWCILEKTDLMWIPVNRSWRLNERHYGALQGLDKKETVAKHGMDQVMIWRRSYTTPPPLLADDSDDLPQNDRKYAGVDPADLPRAESLKLTKDRFLVEWENEIAPAIKSGKRILIVAHGNTIRGLCQHLDEISDEDIVGLDIPTGVPLVFTLDKDLKPITHPEAIPPLSARYLGDVSGIRARIEAVKAQTK